MKSAIIPLIIVALASLACEDPYSRKASLPASLQLKARIRYTEVYPRIHYGARTPMGVKRLTAFCEDPGVCRVLVQGPPASGSYLKVVGLKAGKTTLQLEYFHPVRKKIIRERVPITVAAQETFPILAVGQPLPTQSRVRFPIEDEKGAKVDALCSGGPALPHISVMVRPGSMHYRCHIPEDLGRGIHAVRECTGVCPVKGEERQRYLCVQTTDKTITAISVFRYNRQTGKYEKSHVEGSPVGVICRLRQQ